MGRYLKMWTSAVRHAMLATTLLWAGVVGACQGLAGTPLDGVLDLAAKDGFFIGGDRCFYDPALTPADDVPVFRGTLNPFNDKRLFYVNGANGNPGRIANVLESLAKRSNISTIGLFYYSGDTRELAEGLLPGTPQGAAVDTLQQLIQQAIDRGEPIHIRAGSAGTFVVGEAVRRMHALLSQRRFRPGKGPEQLDLVRIETTGSANHNFPNGPRYIHYINRLDPVAAPLALRGPASQPGARAVLALFTDKAPDGSIFEPDASPAQARFLSVHGPEIYDGYRRPFERLFSIGLDRPEFGYLPRRINLKSIDLPFEGI